MGDYRCALPSRAGRTLIIGDQRVAIGPDGVARDVSGAAAAFLSSQPHIWQRVEAAVDAPQPLPKSAATPEPAATVAAMPANSVVLPRRGARRGGLKKRSADSP